MALKVLSLLTTQTGGMGQDIFLLRLGEADPSPLIASDDEEYLPEVSPDGEWLAYSARRGSATEVIVRPYPDVEGGYFQVSQGGGDDARWSPDGRQLFYRNGQAMMKVDVAGETPATWSRPVRLFAGAFFVDGLGHKYDVDPIDGRFLMVKRAGELETRVVVVQNWFEELTERVPVDSP